MESDEVRIYTDGACSGNPGPGGWGAVLTWRGREKEISGWSGHTTNNRMELLAAIRALEALRRPVRVVLVTDSQYLKKGITEWLPRWEGAGWRTKAGGSVKNQDLWRRLRSAMERHRVEWRWIKGHAQDPYNERADRLARRAIEEGLSGRLPEDPEGRL